MTSPSTYGAAEADLARDLAQTWRVVLTGTRANGSSYTHTLDRVDPGASGRLQDVQVSFVSTRTPRADVTLTAVPLDGALVADLDARRPLTALVQVGYGSAAPADLVTVKADQGLILDDGRLVVTGASAEQAVLDAAELVDPVTPAPQPAHQLLSTLFALTGITSFSIGNPENLTGGTVALEEVTDLWDALTTVAESQGWRVYGPPRESAALALEVRQAPGVTTPTAATLTTGPGGTITEHARRVDRGEFANEVVTVYEWTDLLGEEHRVIGRATDWRTADPATGNTRRATYRYRLAATQPYANAVAEALLRRSSARAVSYQLSAVNAFWLRPDQAVSLPDPATGAQVAALVDQVTFTTDGVMHLVTRAMPELWTLADAAAAYPTLDAHKAAYPTLRAAAVGPI